MKVTSLRHATAAALAALVVVLAGASPAFAAARSASGTMTCPVGETVRVVITLESAAPLAFSAGTIQRYSSPSASTRTDSYGTRSTNWRVVTSTGDIRTTFDCCASAVR